MQITCYYKSWGSPLQYNKKLMPLTLEWEIDRYMEQKTQSTASIEI